MSYIAEDTQCSICLSKLYDKEPNDIFITPCGHGFCIDCVEQNLSNECPNCREIINLPFHQETNRYPEIGILREALGEERVFDVITFINNFLATEPEPEDYLIFKDQMRDIFHVNVVFDNE